MGQAIGGSLPLAIGIAVSPMPIVAVVLMLTSRRAKVNGVAFVLGWLIGLGVVGTVVLVLAGASGASGAGTPATSMNWVKIALGIVLLRVGARVFRRRPTAGTEPERPGWMTRVEQARPGIAVGLGVALAAANPKNLVLAVGGAAAIAQTGISGGQQAIAYLVFALVGTLGVGIPVAMYLAVGSRAEARLADLKDWMSSHNAVIIAVLCLIIAAKLIGDGISGLTS